MSVKQKCLQFYPFCGFLVYATSYELHLYIQFSVYDS